MKPHTLKSLLGKFISSDDRIKFCHVDRILRQEGNNAIVNAVIIMQDQQVYHWYIAVTWTQDADGVFVIQRYETLKEEQIYGYNGYGSQHANNLGELVSGAR